ncbi:MAG: DMT family transporter [Verrucomicrobia bacterium]|nr:DMT family transporter [Verrucomicrobiota bacterium]
MLLSSAMLSFFTLFGKFATGNTSYFLLLFLRFGIPLLLLLPYLLWTMPAKTLLHTHNFKLQMLRSGCILIYQYSIFYYLMGSSLLNATVLQNTAPLFMPVIERIFFGIRFNKRILISIFVSFAGVLCILQPDDGILATISIAGILAPLGQAGSQVLYGHQAQKDNQKVTLFYFFFISTIVTGVVFLFSNEFLGAKNSLEHFSLFAWANIIGLGLASIFNQSLRGLAYKYGSPSALAPFLYVSLILSAILDWAIFHDLPNWLSLAGALLVIAGGMIQMYKKK